MVQGQCCISPQASCFKLLWRMLSKSHLDCRVHWQTFACYHCPLHCLCETPESDSHITAPTSGCACVSAWTDGPRTPSVCWQLLLPQTKGKRSARVPWGQLHRVAWAASALRRLHGLTSSAPSLSRALNSPVSMADSHFRPRTGLMLCSEIVLLFWLPSVPLHSLHWSCTVKYCLSCLVGKSSNSHPWRFFARKGVTVPLQKRKQTNAHSVWLM